MADRSEKLKKRLSILTTLGIGLGIAAVIHLGRTEDIGWILAVVIVATHVGVIAGVWTWVSRTVTRRRSRTRSTASGDVRA